jgi:protease I
MYMIAKILMLVAADGFQAMEYANTRKVLEGAGHTVLVVSDKPGKARDHMGNTINVDLTLSQVHNLDEYRAIVLVGGPGALEHLDRDITYRIIQRAVENNLVVAAICISPRILAKAGALVGMQATGWDEDGKLQEVFDKHAVIYLKQPIVTDGLRVTARGPKEAEGFGKAILELL